MMYAKSAAVTHSGSTNLIDSTFKDNVYNEANFSSARLNEAEFVNADLSGVNFSKSNLIC